MTHLSSTSVALRCVSSSLPNKAWRGYDSIDFISIVVAYIEIYRHPTQVHIPITISPCSYIDYFHEFAGSALARFERSTHPDHEGTRTIVLRITTPVKCLLPLYDGFVCLPKEGELHRRTKYIVRSDQVDQPLWSFNIDKAIKGVSTRAFQLLWDT